jgi:hypothetical protein
MTVARTIERHLSLLATALRTDFSMDGRTKALFFPFFADGATQMKFLGIDYFTEGSAASDGGH